MGASCGNQHIRKVWGHETGLEKASGALVEAFHKKNIGVLAS